MKNKINYKNFIVYYNENEITHFRTKTGVNFESSARDVLKFLNVNKLDKEYELLYNSTSFKISKGMTEDELIDIYLSKIMIL